MISTLDEGSLTAMALSERDKAILDFEGSWWREPGPKQAAIRRRLDLSDTRYYQLLAALAGSPEAASYDPLVVRRVRRTRALRRRTRILGPNVPFGGKPAQGASGGRYGPPAGGRPAR